MTQEQGEGGPGAGQPESPAVTTYPAASAGAGTPAAPRKNKTLRDMALSMGLLVVVVLAFVGIYGGFSFAPAGPTVNTSAVPTTDAVAKFAQANRVLPFTPLTPQGLPADWRANSAGVTLPGSVAAGTPLTVRGGWLTPAGHFITLIASNAEPAILLSAEFGGARPTSATVDVAGTSWQVTTGVRDEVAWYRQRDGVTYLITGSAEPADFTILATSINR